MLKNDRSQLEVNQRLKFIRGLLSENEKPLVEDPLYRDLFALVQEGDINDAENLLFEKLEDGDLDTLHVALAFYDRLNAFSERELESMGFRRKEIKDGLDDIMEAFGLKMGS